MDRKQQIKVIAFDFGGTLFHQPTPREIGISLQLPTLKRLGYPLTCEQFQGLAQRTDRILRRYSHPKDLEEGLWPTVFFDLLGVKITKPQARAWDRRFWRFLLAHTTLMPGAYNILRYLRRKGLKIAFVTNSTVKSAQFKTKKFGLAKYADFIIVSEEIGHKKSTLQPFARLLREADVLPEEVLMVGDDPAEDLCAKKLGIKTALFSPARLVKGRYQPDYTISKLEEIKKLI